MIKRTKNSLIEAQQSKKGVLGIVLLMGIFFLSFNLVDAWSAKNYYDGVAYWNLDETSGDAIDSLNNNDGDVFGATHNVIGRVGTGYRFDGVNDYIRVSDNNSLDINNQITISAWINTTETGTMRIVNKESQSNDSDTYLLAIVSNKIWARINGTDGVAGVSNVNNGLWNHIMFTYDGATMSVYLNGKLENSASSSKVISSTDNDLFIGAYQSTAGGTITNYFNGSIDEVGIWNRSLSASEVMELYRTQVSSYHPLIDGEELLFTSNQNLTRYLQVPSAVTALTKAFMNLSGYGIDLSDGLVVHYKMNDDAATKVIVDNTTINDGYSYRNTNTISTSGKINTALEFDGVDDFVYSESELIGLSNSTQTFSLWYNASSLPAGAVTNSILTLGKNDSEDNVTMILKFTGNKETVVLANIASSNCDNVLQGDSDLVAGVWYLYTVVQDSSSVKLYRNGELLDTAVCYGEFKYGLDWSHQLVLGKYVGGALNRFNGTIDDVRVYNRSLTQAEVQLIYNSGIGTEEILYPNDVSFDVGNLGIWNFTGEFNQLNNRTNNFASYINQYLNLTYLIESYYYIPFIFHSDTAGILKYSDLLFDNLGFIENSQTYNNETIEGTIETFEINITYDSDFYENIQGNLYYNDTSYIGTQSGSGNNVVFTYELEIPNVGSETNFTFYWEIVLVNGTYNPFNSTSYNQTVSILALDDCSAYSTLMLNYSLKDEETQVVIDGNVYNTSVEVDLDIYPIGSSTPIIEYSQNFSENNNPQVCLNTNLSNSSYRIDVQTRYDGDAYAGEILHMQNATLSNSSLPQNINLFDLKDADAQKFLITFKDENFIPVEDALIDIQRRYISEGVSKSIEIPKTDRSGHATASFDLDAVVYSITVTKYGEVLATFDNIAVICQDAIIGDCRINLNALSSGSGFDNYEEAGGITYSMSFDGTARTITTSFTTTDGSERTIIVNTTKFDGWGNDTICTNSLTSSSGTLTCTIPQSYGNTTVISELYSNGEKITMRSFSFIPDASIYFGSDSAIMVVIMLLTIPLMLVSSPIAMIIGVIVGLLMASLLMLFDAGSFLNQSSILIWAVLSGGIIIWQISQRRGI